MRRKIIFIDIDGPLAWGTWGDGRVTINKEMGNEFTIPYPFVKEDCEALQSICDETNADLVLSSDWRNHYSIRDMRDVFTEYGIHASLIDFTTYQSLWARMSRPPMATERALQVTKWVKDNRISNWIAIDDLNLSGEFKWMKPRIPMWRHVQVDGDFGFGGRLRDKVDECIKKLER